MTRAVHTRTARIAAIGGLALVSGLLALVLLGVGGSSYTIYAQFYSAGRLVDGGEVQVAGRKVGSVAGVDLSPDNLAVIELALDDDSVVPLREGARAEIRAVGAGTLTNNFVDIRPGPRSAPALDDGAVLAPRSTRELVDLDALLSSLDEPARADFKALIDRSSEVFAGSGSGYFNRMLAKLDPALEALEGFTGELASDRAGLERFVARTASAATAVASRRQDLRSAVGNTARTLGAIAGERNALADILTRAPAVLDQGRGTLADLDDAVGALRPTLRDVPPAAQPLRRFLESLDSGLGRATPVVGELRGQLPGLRRALATYPSLQGPAIKGLRSTGNALRDSRHILAGFRVYGPDFILGIVNGLVAIGSGTYSKAGHYLHTAISQTPQTFLGGAGQLLLPPEENLIPGVFGVRTGLSSRCPGGNAPPAPDGSSPWIPDPDLCDPSHDIPASVNEP